MQQPIIGMEGQTKQSGGKKRWLFMKVMAECGGIIRWFFQKVIAQSGGFYE